jgi:thiosulfate/3-mercaptopyruvate sulfurtransferase
MFWRTSFLVVLIFVGACRGREEAAAPVSIQVAEKAAYAHPGALIEAGELLAKWEHEHIRIIDFREQAAFEQEHIPNAQPMWRSDIEDKEHHVPGMMASKPEMEKLLSDLGLSASDTLIIYDDQAGVNAARLWWVLQTYGFNQARLLNGGLQSWKDAKGPLGTEWETLPANRFEFPPEEALHLRIDKDELVSLMAGEDWTLIDARTAEEYSGKRMKKGAQNAGHIPGSVHIDWADAVDYHGTKKFLPPEKLQIIYRELPEDKDAPVVVYCHSGVRSAHTSFVLTQLLGYNRVYNYDGSWLEWSSLKGARIDKDSTTLILQ